MHISRVLVLAVWALIVMGTCPLHLHAQLRPDEVAILAVRGSRESRAVAAYYAKVRGVPADQIMQLDVPPGKNLSRDDWEGKVRPAIRRWLAEKRLLSKVRCLVTVWDMPLRIGKADPGRETQELVAYLQAERRERVGLLNDYLQSLKNLVGQTPQDGTDDTDESSASEPQETRSGAAAPESDSSQDTASSDAASSDTAANWATPLPEDAPLATIKERLDQAFGAAQQQVTSLPDEETRQQAMQQLRMIYFRAVGLNMMAQSLARQLQSGAANPQTRSEFDIIRGRTLGLREGRVVLESLPPSLDRDSQLLSLIQLSDGIYGTIAWIDEQLATIKKNETGAAFDSELALVAWPNYSLLRWQPNLLHYRFDESIIRTFRPTFMVARLESPTLRRTRGMIDDAIAVEKEGLKGKVYLDARGLATLEDQVQRGAYPDYDQSLLQAAEALRKYSSLEVVLDKRQDLFQPGDCPDAALYCGWYSLAQYIDAFEWNRGAVGYHMASAEATKLRDPESEVWCKRMLEDGVCATLGPVAEPYIAAFPRPSEFFPLLASGKFTLAEVYWRTVPFASWQMILIGDPLYNPYGQAPPLKIDQVDDEAIKRLVLGPQTVLPVPSK